MPILTDEHAHQLCRTPKVSPGRIKKVLAWAEADPRPDKVPYLLILQTGNWATRKGLDDPFHAALAACGSTDTSPLWDTIAGDWETYRIWHAIRCLVGLDRRDELERLVALGAQPLLGIHWQPIEQAAARRAVPIPAEVSEVLEGLAGLSMMFGGPRGTFEARQEAWPPQLDPDPALAKRKRVVLSAVTDSKAATRAEALGTALAALEAQLREHQNTSWTELARNPPATDADLEHLAAELFGGGDLPPELPLFFGWHLGEQVSQAPFLDEDFSPLSLKQAITEWQQLVEFKQDGICSWFRPTAVPLFANGAGDFLLFETKGARAGQLFHFVHDQPGLPRAHKSLADWATALAKTVASGGPPTQTPTRPAGAPPPSEEVALPWELAFELSFDCCRWVEREPVRSCTVVRAMEAGTALRWRLLGTKTDRLAAVKLGADAWCVASHWGGPEAEEASVRSLKILASRVPQTAWRMSDEQLFGWVSRAPTPVQTAVVKLAAQPAGS